MMRSVFNVLAVILSLLGLQACAPSGPASMHEDTAVFVESTAPEASEPATTVGLASREWRFVYAPAIDRVTSFRTEDGPEMLFTRELDARPLADEAYTFYGGGYSWTSPQGGNAGWVDTAGTPRAWPPDPAMDIGPAIVVSESAESLITQTPVSRLGLIERKTFTLSDVGLEFSYALENNGDETRAAGTWINTAVHSDAMIAVRLVGPDAMAHLRGWDQQSIDRFVSITTRLDNGWAILDLSKAQWEGGIKVYVPRMVGELPTIAVWRDGQWFQRTQRVTEHATETLGRLQAMGEGAIATYIQPGATPDEWVIEAELYGPVVDIPAGESHEASESWRLIESPGGPDTDLLEVQPDPAVNAQPAG